MHLQGCLIQKIGFVIRVPFENSARGGTTGPAAPARAVPLFRLVRRTSFSGTKYRKKNLVNIGPKCHLRLSKISGGSAPINCATGQVSHACV